MHRANDLIRKVTCPLKGYVRPFPELSVNTGRGLQAANVKGIKNKRILIVILFIECRYKTVQHM